MSDVESGRALQPYRCNLLVLANVQGPGFLSLQGYGDCAYVSRGPAAGGVSVFDVSDPTQPQLVDMLGSVAMMDPWESLRVNGRRKLLVAGSPLNGYLDIYDLSADCRHPRLLSSTDLSPAHGHEGWFSPDGNVYYMSGLSVAESTGAQDRGPNLSPIDIRDPRRPRPLAVWTPPPNTTFHGGSTALGGDLTFICEQGTAAYDRVVTLDTADVAASKAGARLRPIGSTPLKDNQFCQSSYQVSYHGRPYLLQFGEAGGASDCSRAADKWATFSYPRIYDVTVPTRPRLVAEALLESALPKNCPEVAKQAATGNRDFGVHQCSPDRLVDPTILACSYWNAGVRVLDIRDPKNVRELGYFNPGADSAVGTASNVVVRSDRREIWVVNLTKGFFILKFASGVWPFASASPCPPGNDYFFATYNESSKCKTATFSGLAPSGPSNGTAAVPSQNPRTPDARATATPSAQRLASTGGSSRSVAASLLLLLVAGAIQRRRRRCGVQSSA